MSHTLHRTGSDESLAKDYAVLVMPENGLNDQDSEQKLRCCFDVLLRHNPVNCGDSKNGSRYSLGNDQAVIDAIEEKETVFVVYGNEDDLFAALRDLKEVDQGLSVVVSGLFNHTCACAKKAGLEPHTAGISLGVIGNTARLPDEDTLEITTMCGHGLIAFSLVKHLADRVAKGRLSADKAGEQLARCCICGVFNTVRATAIIGRMARQSAS